MGNNSRKFHNRTTLLVGSPNFQEMREHSLLHQDTDVAHPIYTTEGELIAKIHPDKIVINAIDKGPGIPDVEEAMRPGYSTAPNWVRELGFGAGMGLPNIKNYTDEMTLDSKVNKGTNLRFVVYANQ